MYSFKFVAWLEFAAALAGFLLGLFVGGIAL